MTSNTTQREQVHALSDRDFKYICQFVYDATGIVLDERKREMVYRRLMRRTRATRQSSFTAYIDFLKTSEEELPNFINAITTNLTSFFRENHHFDFLRQTFFPDILSNPPASKRLRIWSAGCSTGEEPYSIAMTLAEEMKSHLHQWDAKILATDLDSDVVAHGQAGIYKLDNTTGIEQARFKRWFKKGSKDNEDLAKVSPELAQLITFKQLNLLGQWPMKGPFDIIFCRNVVIYFDKPTQQTLFSRFHQLLAPNGYLIIGHSENLGEQKTQFSSIGKTIFRKIV